LPEGVGLVLAAKSCSNDEISQAIDAGVTIIGENYVQEAQKAREAIGARAKWHLIGHLQKNKVKKAVLIFDMIETVDSFEIAQAIDNECGKINKKMPVLVEVNSAGEAQKTGVLPQAARELVEKISRLKNIEIEGLMTMGPLLADPEELRPYFKKTKQLFEDIKRLGIPGVKMRYLSMGMTTSYKIAIEEGANLVRIGTKIFGERHYGQ